MRAHCGKVLPSLPQCCQDQGGFPWTQEDAGRRLKDRNRLTSSGLLPEVPRRQSLMNIALEGSNPCLTAS